MSEVGSNARDVAERKLTGFPRALREAGLAVDPGRAATFLNAVRLCRLDGPGDLARIGRVTLAGSPDEIAIFDAVFEAWFGEETFAGRIERPEEDQALRPAAPRGERMPVVDLATGEAAGHAAAEDHLHARKSFDRPDASERDALARLGRRLDRLPAVTRRSWVPAPAGRRIDLARTSRAARRTLGETLHLVRSARPQKPRRLLFLIDVSGSMKADSQHTLRFAHCLTRRHPGVETFCFGTRLSRVTGALRLRDAEAALARLSDIVFDFDGGTLIGPSLEEFLSVSRHAALVRGALTFVFSDGLERGDPAAMIHAAERLARLSHRLFWVTPLAADPRYKPATRGMAGILPVLDGLFDGSSLGALERVIARLEAAERLPRGMAGRRLAREEKTP